MVCLSRWGHLCMWHSSFLSIRGAPSMWSSSLLTIHPKDLRFHIPRGDRLTAQWPKVATVSPCRNHHLIIHLGFLFNPHGLPHSGHGFRDDKSDTTRQCSDSLSKQTFSRAGYWGSFLIFPMWAPWPPNPAAQQALSSHLVLGTGNSICFSVHCLGNVTGGSYGGNPERVPIVLGPWVSAGFTKHGSVMCDNTSFTSLHISPLCQSCYHSIVSESVSSKHSC